MASVSRLSWIPPRLRKAVLLASLAFLALWLLFFDSHSLFTRFQWHRELEQLTAENEQLQEQIDALEASLEQGLSDDDVERIAREQYGMRRPGDTVYRIQQGSKR